MMFLIEITVKYLEKSNFVRIFAARIILYEDIMSREDIVQKWLDIVEQDIKVAELTHSNGYWLYAAFLCHQALEKVIKAYWTATRDDDPPYTHSHAKLLEGCGLIGELSEERLSFIAMMIPMFIEARYPSYKEKVGASLNEQTSAHILETTKELIQWIKEKLSANSRP